MGEEFLDYEGLSRYTQNVKDLVLALMSDAEVLVPDLSNYAPKADPEFTGSISMGRSSSTTVGNGSTALGSNVEASNSNSFSVGDSSIASGSNSHAEGSSTTASGESSHAEGHATTASGNYSHAEGYNTSASGNHSHAEGHSTSATSNYNHAEGRNTAASGSNSHAEGYSTKAIGSRSHSEGTTTEASGNYSHAEGMSTVASNIASHAGGKYSAIMTDGATSSNQVGDVFVIGNGNGSASTDRSNALRLAYEGTLYLTKAYKSTGADYAEYFEWLDGNSNNEDRVGHFVTLTNDKIMFAQPGEYALGVVSGQPCIIGNADEDWLGRWEHDEFNRFIKEYLVHNEVEVTPPSDLSLEDLHQWMIENEIEERDGKYVKMETKVVDYETPSWRHKQNLNYDSSQPYIERKDRKEWDAVGMLGVLSVIDDGTCMPNSYCKVGLNGIAIPAVRHDSEDSWRVIERVTPNVIKIVFSIK